jgi:RHS repeat-associated protein
VATPASVSRTVEYAWDDASRCAGVLVPGSDEWLLFDRGDDGTLVVRAESGRVYLHSDGGVVTYGNGTRERLTLDRLGRPARIETLPDVLDLEYAYDREGRIERIGAHRIEYDGDRVVSPRDTGGVRFEEDGDGNRTARVDVTSRTDYRYADGRLAAVMRDGETVVTYGYDDLGRRVRRNGVNLHLDARGYLLAETDEEGRALATYIRDGHRCLARIDGPVGDEAAEWYHLDHTGTAWAVTDAAGRVTARRSGPLDPPPGPFMGRFRDEATGFHDFGARDYDDETGRFTTPDPFTFDADDPRLGVREAPRVLEHWSADPALRDRHDFCLGDPVNNVDLDGHSAWWFFLTIPSSLVWAIPNTIVAFMIVLINLYAEVLGWIIWPFFMLAKWDTGLKYYPWGYKTQTGSDPANPYDLDERDHIWFGLDASPRLGVPWALFNGSFFSVGRAFTMGNVIFYDRTAQDGDSGDSDARYVPPKDPDTQLTLVDAVHQHEMQHTFQYSYLGPLFHCLPLALIARMIENKVLDQDALARSRWWQKFDLGGATTIIGGLLLKPLTFNQVSFSDVETWANPAEWWRHLFPGRFTEIVTQANSLDNWIPGVGIYEWDMWIRGGQDKSWFERNSGAWSGHTYGLVCEAEEDEVYVGQFTRIVGADLPRGPAGPGGTTRPWQITWATDPAATSTLSAIDLDKPNRGTTRQVVNATGVYFHATAPGDYTVTGTADPLARSGAPPTEAKKIKVKDVGVEVQATVFIGERQTLKVDGDKAATYSLRPKDVKSGGSVNGLGYTAGATAGVDVLELIATYDGTKGVFETYGDNGLAATPVVVKEISITVKEPTITPSANEVFVGGSVTFTIDHDPQRASSSANVPGSTYDSGAKRFTAGRGAIGVARDETITFDYGVKQYPVTIHVKPIGVAAAPAQVSPGGFSQLTVFGGTPPYTYAISLGGTSGGSVDASGQYHAGTTAVRVTDVVTATDANGGRGTVAIPVGP